MRVLFRGDARNVSSVSDPVSIIIQQAQVPSFTINTSDPIVNDGTPATISGTLYAPGSTTTPESGATVELFGHVPQGGSYRELQSTHDQLIGRLQLHRPELDQRVVPGTYGDHTPSRRPHSCSRACRTR